MTDERHKQENIRDAAWMKNAPEWLGEVVAQLTENRQGNAEMLERLLDREKALNTRDRDFEHRAVILRDSQNALIKAVEDLKEFANSLYGPQSAFAQLNAKLSDFSSALEEDRKRNDSRHQEVKLAQSEMDDHINEIERATESEFDVIRNRLKEVEREISEMKQ